MPKDYEHLDEMMVFIGCCSARTGSTLWMGNFLRAHGLSKGSHFDAIIAEEEGMPRWEDINFEVDLMVENPEAVVSKWVSAGASVSLCTWSQ